MKKTPLNNGFCLCGCGGETNITPHNDIRHGWIKGKPLRFILNHHRRKKQLYTKLKNGCWAWNLMRNKFGYGVKRDNGRSALAHRFMYEKMVGPIPLGLTIDHLCRNRSCVNPKHLDPVTHAENCRRGRLSRLGVKP